MTHAEAPAAGRGPLELLLLLQEHDSALDQLRYRRAHLPERAELAAIDKELAAIGADLRTVQAARATLGGRQDELEQAIDGATSRIVTIEKQLYHGDGVAFRDQQAMAAEVEALRKRRSQLEDDELAVMEELEPLDDELAALQARHDAASGERGRLLEAIASAEGVLDGEIAAVGTVRAHVVSGVPADLAAEYERLRAKLGGGGAARLVGGRCDGCHLTLPATDLDHIRHAPPGTLFHCDQCGRILVP